MASELSSGVQPAAERTSERDGVVKCRRCRNRLFFASDILSHVEGKGQEAFSWYKRSHETQNVEVTRDFISVEKEELSDPEGDSGQSLLEVLSQTHKVEYSEQVGGYVISGEGEWLVAGGILNSCPAGGRMSPKLNCISASMKSSNCQSLFVEQSQWMENSVVGSSQGKLTCPKCRARLGSFNWSGLQCSCGQWITPAFQIHKTKIDLIAFN